MVMTGKTQAQVDAANLLTERQAEIDTLTTLLASTDWYVARWGETGKPIPPEIAAERVAARGRISELRSVL